MLVSFWVLIRRSDLDRHRRVLLQMLGAGVLVVGGGNLFSAYPVRAPFTAAAAQSDVVWDADIDNPFESIETIATGFDWTEGPVWLGDENGSLLFSDVPGNAIFRWNGELTTAFLAPSGYSNFPLPDFIREGGSNGLAIGRGGLVIADSGNRCISVVDLATRSRTILADNYQGKRFNSPNDLVIAQNGDVYFTDPPFGLVGVRESPLRELAFTGVFRIDANNQVHLIADNLNPNGIALSPDNRILYVTDADGWMAIDLDENGVPGNQRLLIPRSALDGRGDGMKVDIHGNLWTSGPGGIHVFSETGQHLGFASIDGRASNLAFGHGGLVYITNDNNVLRAKIRAGFAQH